MIVASVVRNFILHLQKQSIDQVIYVVIQSNSLESYIHRSEQTVMSTDFDDHGTQNVTVLVFVWSYFRTILFEISLFKSNCDILIYYVINIIIHCRKSSLSSLPLIVRKFFCQKHKRSIYQVIDVFMYSF